MTEPRRSGSTKRPEPNTTDAATEPTHGPTRETILVVEDDPGVRRIAAMGLRSQGYQVLQAASGKEALLLGDSHAGPLHLLVTDVVMPEMNGRQVAEGLKKRRPDLRVLYLSGYGNESITRLGVHESEVAFLQKPFTLTALGSKVREVLDGRTSRRPPSGPHRRAV